MPEVTLFSDDAVVRQVIALHLELRHDPVGARLASIEFGAVDLWSAFQYEIADLLYDDAWSGTPIVGRVGRAKDMFWEATWELAIAKFVDRSGALDLVERTQFNRRSRSSGAPADAEIALVGFAHRAGVMKLPPFTNRDSVGPSFQILLHDDNLGRHRRAVRSAQDRVIAGESLLNANDYDTVTKRAREIAAILAPAEMRTSHHAELWRRFHERSVHRRRFRRLALGAEAVKRFLAGRTIKTIIIPDERQPLARAAALTAKAQSSARIVSVPEPVDQFVRKMPVWGDTIPDLTVLSGQTALRGLTRAGVRDRKFRTCRSEGLERLVSSVTSPASHVAKTNGRRPTVLYCDQGLPGSAERFTQLAESLGNPPRAELIFRPHPSQSSFLLRFVVAGATIQRSPAIVDAIRSSDVVVTHSSMITIVAAMLERPVILWSVEPSPPMPVLLLERVAYWPRSRDELSALIRLLLDAGGDHPLRSQQAAFRRELDASRSAEDLGALLLAQHTVGPR